MNTKPRHIILPAVAFLAVVAVALAVRLWPRTVPFGQCSEVYKKYAAVDGVDAMFIKDYKINDIVFVDVTILKAKDSATWISLKKSFEVPDPSPNFQRLIDEGKDIIATKIIPKTIVTDTLRNSYPSDCLATSYLNRTLTFFHVTNEFELYIVRRYNWDKSINQ